MKSKLIRILIVLCFVGIATFGVVVFIGNFNVEEKVYSEVTKLSNSVDWNNFDIKAQSVKVSFENKNTQCAYVAYVNKATKELNKSIEYYLQYFRNMNGMNKNQKDDLVQDYEEYISAINKAKSLLRKYESFYNKDHDSLSSHDKASIKEYSARFAIQYLKAYGEGFDFFISLQNMVDKKVFGGNMFKNYTQISYEISAILVNSSRSKLTAQLEIKKAGSGVFTSSPYSADVSANNFNKLMSETKITSATEYTTSDNAKFLTSYNQISKPTEFFKDRATYIASNSSEASAAAFVKNYLTSAGMGLTL